LGGTDSSGVVIPISSGGLSGGAGTVDPLSPSSVALEVASVEDSPPEVEELEELPPPHAVKTNPIKPRHRKTNAPLLLQFKTSPLVPDLSRLNMRVPTRIQFSSR
jgi:hypothetical protein